MKKRMIKSATLFENKSESIARRIRKGKSNYNYFQISPNDAT